MNLEAVMRKLNAILAKDAAAIHAQGVAVPWLAPGYTVADLQAWLDKRRDVLDDARVKNYSDAQLQTLYSNAYASLSTADRALIDGAVAGNAVDLTTASSLAAYEKIVAMILYRLAITTG